MTTTGAQRSPGIARRRRRSRRPGLALFAAVNAVSAWGGALALTAGWIDFGDRLNRRLPFGSLKLAGVALGTIVAVPLTVLSWLAWRGDRRVGRAAVLTGAMLVGWIAVQLVFLREFSGFQPAYAAIGCMLVLIGRRIEHLSSERRAR